MGVVMGASGTFSPEQLGLTCSSTIGWLMFEIFLCKMGTYLLNLDTVSLFELVALCSYKFLGIILTSVIYTLSGSTTAFWAAAGWCSLSLAFFTFRTLAGAADGDAKRAFVFNASVAAVQVLFLLWTTSQLLFLPTPKVTIDLDV